jgi:hypothetical protein
MRIFNIILTPNYNAAHRDHFHVDLTPNAHFLGKPGRPSAPGEPTLADCGGHAD